MTQSSASAHHRIAHGALWAFIASWSKIALSLIAFALIARIIGPEQFGLNTGAAALVMFGQVLVGTAAGEVIIQRRELSDASLSAYLWTLFGIGVLLAVIVVAVSPWIAHVFDHPQMAPLLLLYSGCIPLTALQTVPAAMLSARLEFKAQALAGTVGMTSGCLVGIALALLGAGIWSLGALQFVQIGVNAAVLWRKCHWTPAAPRWDEVPACLRFSSSSVAVRMLDELENQLPKVFIGGILGATALGYFGVSRRIFDLLRDMLLMPLMMVALPSVAETRSRKEDLGVLLKSALKASAFIGYPAFLGLIAVTPTVIPLLFGDSWGDAVVPLQLMCLLGLLSAVTTFNYAILRDYNKGAQLIMVAVISTVLMAVSVPIAAQFGLIAAIGAVVLSRYIVLPIQALQVQQLGVSTWKTQIVSGGPSLLIAVVMSIAVAALRQALDDVLAPLLLLVICITAGAMIYLALSALFTRTELRYALELVRGRRKQSAQGQTD